ncbi:hypothetical protein BDP27DRAFT_1473070 [Rhodocollybia butyracea]|uniref:CxC1-like cysteine cluster associated with KDZ transposases domain-containing protein n=1 Tax=Rhodocollybia butyracea TaxID=206335 RepID=A0A9P5P0Q7_9AGAR|nr:hypothetical protein BDP27DRAFT_1473070 [Rhodocollybia butyracea]
MARVAVIPRQPTTEGSVALVKAGFLGATPQSPSLAISLRTLEVFYTIRLFRPSFSVEAFTKVACSLLSMPYRRGYRTAISDAFDMYIVLRRNIDRRVALKLGQGAENYRVLHNCPPCNYQLKDEPPLEFSRMFVVDGNNSLKRMVTTGGRQTADARVFGDSDYFLSEEFVNQFADEVPSRHETEPALDEDSGDEHEDLPPDVNGGDPTDGQDLESELRRCTNNWKAADKESAKKRMWDGFHECGIFASACRHGFILWIADMIRSGELAKYPLAILAKALQVFGERFMFGYDIGCSFSETIAKTSLNDAFQEKRCQCCVNAFHGYSHNAICQQCFHPIHIPGMGLEDLETLERVFSLSNQLASVTRYMSPYRRRVFIDLYFQQWDRDKYANLATMIHNNYRQALAVLENDAVELAHDLNQLNLTEAELEQLWEEQRRCFQELGKEGTKDVEGVEYVELLQKLRDLEASLERAHTSFVVQEPEDFDLLPPGASYNVNLSHTRKTESRRRYLTEQHGKVLWQVVQMESVLNISRRWTPLDAEYKAALEYMTERKYRQALENLHLLVVKRLFEMHRLNISGTGYKMRTHIASGLQRRAKAIRRAVKEYNKYAVALNPPRDTLDWTKVTHFSFIDQFDILQDTRHSVLKERWAQPLYRELMNRLHKVTRAREEILRCNVEIRRLHTSIVDEEELFGTTLTQATGTVMHGPILDYVSSRRQVNKLLRARIEATYELPGFTGTPYPGESINLTRKLRSVNIPSIMSLPSKVKERWEWKDILDVYFHEGEDSVEEM